MILAVIFTTIIGLGCLLGAVVIFRGSDKDLPDVVVSEAILKRVGIGLAVTSVLTLGSAIALYAKVPNAEYYVLTSTMIFVIGGFWGNKVVFGDYRPTHTGTNVILAAIVWIALVLN